MSEKFSFGVFLEKLSFPLNRKYSVSLVSKASKTILSGVKY